jgi:putative hydrolase of the HAD superfamily
MNATIRSVIVDFGDVLFRTEDPSGRRRWEKHLGLPSGDLARFVFESEVGGQSMMGRATEADVWQHVADTFSLDDETLGQLIRDFWSGVQLDTELVEFVRSLRPRYRTAILSDAWPGVRDVFTQVFGLDAVVDEIIISAEEGIAKPDPRIFRIAAERLGVQPQEAVFVDDRPENVHGARAVGMRGIQFETREQTIADVRKHLEGVSP